MNWQPLPSHDHDPGKLLRLLLLGGYTFWRLWILYYPSVSWKSVGFGFVLFLGFFQSSEGIRPIRGRKVLREVWTSSKQMQDTCGVSQLVVQQLFQGMNVAGLGGFEIFHPGYHNDTTHLQVVATQLKWPFFR